MASKMFSQEDIVLLQIHQFIGDTLDAEENRRFQILNENSESFQYAIFALIEDNVKVIINYEKGNQRQINYSIDRIMQDNQKVDRILNAVPQVQLEDNNSNRSAKLRIIYKNGRNKRIRKFSRIRLMLKDTYASDIAKKTESGLILAKLIKVHDGTEPSITIKLQQKGRPRINIPLNNIEMIRFNTPTENILLKALSVSYLTICFFTTKSSFSDSNHIPIAIVSGIIGVKPLLKGNKRYEIGSNSQFEIFH